MGGGDGLVISSWLVMRMMMMVVILLVGKTCADGASSNNNNNNPNNIRLDEYVAHCPGLQPPPRHATDDPNNLPGYYHTISIHHELGRGKQAWIKCKSGDSEIGGRYLVHGQTLTFKIIVDTFWGHTLWYCYLSFDRDRVRTAFDVFGGDATTGPCSESHWALRRDGIYYARVCETWNSVCVINELKTYWRWYDYVRNF